MRYGIFVLFLFLTLIVLSVIMRLLSNNYIDINYNCQMKRNGYCLINSLINPQMRRELLRAIKANKYSEIKRKIISDPEIIRRIRQQVGLSDEYNFQDYIFLLKKSSVHTCHRDNNSQFFNQAQKHPSYTVLLFLEDMNRCLDIVPGSHTSPYKNGLNLTDPTKSVRCKPRDAIVFDSSLIHSGSFNPRHNNARIQLKISHRDDLAALSYYQNFNKVNDKENRMPLNLRKAPELSVSDFWQFYSKYH